MGPILKWGLVLGILVEIWTYVMGYTGWYKDRALVNLFFLVIPLQVVVLVLALRETASRGRRYWGQVSAGTLVSAIAGIVVFAGSLLFTTVFFPDYFRELGAIQEQILREQGQNEEQIRSSMEAYGRANTPIGNALTGLVACFLTGLVASLVIAAFVRAREASPGVPAQSGAGVQ